MKVKNKNITIERMLKKKEKRIGIFEKDNNAVREKSIIFIKDQPEFPFFFLLSQILNNQS